MIEIIRLSDIGGLPVIDAPTARQRSFIDLAGGLGRCKGAPVAGGIREIMFEGLTPDEKKICRQDYIDAIAGFGAEFSSPEWWANAASEKNEHTSEHFKNLCLFYSLVKLLKSVDDKVVYVACNDAVALQLGAWCAAAGIKITGVRKMRWFGRGVRAFKAVKAAWGVVIRAVVRKLYLCVVAGAHIRKTLDLTKDYYVIRSWIDKGALRQGGVYAKDPYFGRLPEIAAQKGFNTLIVAGILNNFTETVRGLKGAGGFIVPEEYFLSLLDVVRALFGIRLEKTRLKRPVMFNGVDATAMYELEIEKGYLAASYMKNILRRFIAARLARSIRMGFYIQTYENYAWEKMMISGIRKNNSRVRILGFQHAFVSEDSFKYFPGAKERDIVPLPDKIITMGRVTKNILQRCGNYPAGVMTEGCALRQEYLAGVKTLKRRRVDRVVVPLTMVARESALTLDFLSSSGLAASGVKVVIRCHPAAPFETFQRLMAFETPGNFIFDNALSVEEELRQSDMVLYTWTTVAAEALRMGLPVIYLDVLSPMRVDPLFECEMLKKSVSLPEGLVQSMEGFYNMTDEEFNTQQAGAQSYLEDYFYPVTPENLAPFFSR